MNVKLILNSPRVLEHLSEKLLEHAYVLILKDFDYERTLNDKEYERSFHEYENLMHQLIFRKSKKINPFLLAKNIDEIKTIIQGNPKKTFEDEIEELEFFVENKYSFVNDSFFHLFLCEEHINKFSERDDVDILLNRLKVLTLVDPVDMAILLIQNNNIIAYLDKILFLLPSKKTLNRFSNKQLLDIVTLCESYFINNSNDPVANKLMNIIKEKLKSTTIKSENFCIFSNSNRVPLANEASPNAPLVDLAAPFKADIKNKIAFFSNGVQGMAESLLKKKRDLINLVIINKKDIKIFNSKLYFLLDEVQNLKTEKEFETCEKKVKEFFPNENNLLGFKK